MFRRLLIAVQFLTVLPVRMKSAPDEDALRASVAMYPVVGFMIGFFGLAVYSLCGMIWPPSITAMMVLVSLTLVTGGLHLDGLSDTADGLSVQGDRERRLKAMRDPAAGPLGVAAVVFVLLIKYMGLRSLEDLSYFGLYGTLLFMPLMGRWAMVVAMAAGQPAQDNGLGRVYLGRLGTARVIGALVAALVCLAIGAALLRDYTPTGAYWFLGASLVLAACVALALNLVFWRVLGGQSGDTLGATCELAETIFLLGALAWSKFYIL